MRFASTGESMKENPYESPNDTGKIGIAAPVPFTVTMLIFAGLGLGYVAVLYRHPFLDNVNAFFPVAFGIVVYGMIAFYCGLRSRT